MIKNNVTQKQIETTPTTSAIATIFITFIIYFILEMYFLASEYYASNPPYTVIVTCAIVGGVIVIFVLNYFEPKRKDSIAYAAIFSIGVGLVSYALIPRINIILDSGNLESYEYVLSENYEWIPHDKNAPILDLYMHNSDWWNQYKPGDNYSFNLRKGGLDIWLVDMSPIYEEQKKYYKCEGVLSCITK